MRNRIWAALLGASVLMAVHSAQAQSLTAARTRVYVVHARSISVARTASGKCWTNSIASGRTDAYRCMVGNAISDPCFSLNARNVVCPINATNTRGTQIRLTAPLPPPSRSGARNAWLMRLAGGATCNIGTGTVVSGYPFYCTGGLVCSGPRTRGVVTAVFVSCGRAKSSIEVNEVGRYLVTALYE